MLVPAAPTSLDPLRMTGPAYADVAALLYRGLTAFPPDGGHAVADLATDAGEASAGATTWTFHLRPGIRFADGTPITSAEVVHAADRALAAHSPAPAYLRALVSGATAPDASTVVFQLSRPDGQFADVAASPAFAPVPLSGPPQPSGPYQPATFTPGKALTLARNPQWARASDPVHPAWPDGFHFLPGASPAGLASALSADAEAVPLAVGLPPGTGETGLQAAADGSVDLLVLDSTAPPLDNVTVRAAIAYAVARAPYAAALAGVSAATPASTLIPPLWPAHHGYDYYPTPPGGDPARARRQIAGAGYPQGFPVTLADPDPATAPAVRAALSAAGLTVRDAGPGHPATVSVVHWSPAYPSPEALLRPLFCSCGSADTAHYTSADVEARMTRAAQASGAAADLAWTQVGMRIMQDVPAVPLVNRERLLTHGAAVHGAQPDFAYAGNYDLDALWLG